MILDPSGRLAAELAAAVRFHRERLDPRKVPLPVLLDLRRIERLFRCRAGQSGSTSPPAAADVDSVRMTTVLLLTFDEAAQSLGVSLATVKRLVRRGDLRAVKVAGCARITPDALVDFVWRLQQEPAA